jgi:hypothetical protein
MEKAISLLHGKTLMGRILTVAEARPQKKRDREFRDGMNGDTQI